MSLTLQSGGQNQKWPTSGPSGYITPTICGVHNASTRGTKSEVAHKWANYQHHPYHLRGPQRFKARGKNRRGPVVASLLLFGGSPTLQGGGQNQKWPTSGPNGYITPAVDGVPHASERDIKSEVTPRWADCRHHPCRLGDPRRFTAGPKIRSGQQVGMVATSPLPSQGSPTLQSGESKFRSGTQVGLVATSPLLSGGFPTLHSGRQNQKRPTNEPSGYVTPAM